MVFTVMGWLIASHVLFGLSQRLRLLETDQAEVARLRQLLATRDPYRKLLAQPDSRMTGGIRRHVLAGLHGGHDLLPQLAALSRLFTIDTAQLSRYKDITQLLLIKCLVITATCLGFRLYFLPWSAALLPTGVSDTCLCLGSAVILVVIFRWWRRFELLSATLRQDSYQSWLKPVAPADGQLRQEGLAATTLSESLARRVETYGPEAEQRTRQKEEWLGVLDLACNGVIAALTLAAPLGEFFAQMAW